MKKKFLELFTFSILMISHSTAQSFVTRKPKSGAFPSVTAKNFVSIYVDNNDEWLVHKAASLLQSDIERVTARKPPIMIKAHSN